MRTSFRNWSLKPLIVLSVLSLAFTSCSDDDSGESLTEEENARLTIRMTDAPGDYDAVYVDVQDVMIRTDAETEDGEDGWQSLENVETGRYDLLQLTGGITQLLADSEIPAGYLDQIRLVLGNDNAVVIDGDEEPLSTPSAQQSGLKLNVSQELEPGEDYEYLLDFDVDESIVTTGNGGFSLKPVVRLSAYANTGVIVGDVHPTDVQTLVRASNGSNTISAYTDNNGEFTLHAVPEGTYRVTITPAEKSGFAPVEINNVEVQADGTTNLETTFIDE